jgi:hypothetical protein
MKTAVLPPVRVDPKVKKEIEAVLEPGETLSSFVTESVVKSAALRRAQREFVARAEARSRTASRTGKYVSSDAVYARLTQVIARAKKKTK